MVKPYRGHIRNLTQKITKETNSFSYCLLCLFHSILTSLVSSSLFFTCSVEVVSHHGSFLYFPLWQYHYPEQISIVKIKSCRLRFTASCYSERHFPRSPSILICISHINLVIKVSQKTLEFLLLQIISFKNNQDTSQWPQDCPRFSCHCAHFSIQHSVPSQLLLDLDCILWVSE